jgi:hypothetical protein
MLSRRRRGQAPPDPYSPMIAFKNSEPTTHDAALPCTGPDLLGLCEIENEDVLKTLLKEIGREDYQIAHLDSPDLRGIDTTLVYSEKIFRKPAKSDMRGHTVHLRYATRDIFEVRLRLKGSGTTPELSVLVNHWPSRKNGQYETEPLRISTAEHAGRLVDGYLKYSRAEFLGRV